MLDLNVQKFLFVLMFHLLSKHLSTSICFSTYEEDFNPDLKGRWNAEYNVTPLIPVAVFPVDAVTRTDDWSRFWFGYLRTHFKYSVIFQCQQLHLKIFEMVSVATHYSFLLIYNALITAYCIIKLNRCCWPSFI